MFQPFRSRRIEQEEALRILKEEDERGHIHTVWFKSAMLNRFFAICNCCKCCCLGMKFMNEYSMKIIQPSGYLAVIGDDCIGCGRCKEHCQFDAIEFISSSNNGEEAGRCEIIPDKCFGCGICEEICPNEAIAIVDGVATLARDEDCEDCGVCVEFCEQEAITIEQVDVEMFSHNSSYHF